MSASSLDADRVGRRLLFAGLLLSGVLIAVGLVLTAVGGSLAATVTPLDSLLAALAASEPAAFISVGLLILIATPVLRLASAMVSFGREGDLRFAGVTAVVLAIVLAGLVLGRG